MDTEWITNERALGFWEHPALGLVKETPVIIFERTSDGLVGSLVVDSETRTSLSEVDAEKLNQRFLSMIETSPRTYTLAVVFARAKDPTASNLLSRDGDQVSRDKAEVVEELLEALATLLNNDAFTELRSRISELKRSFPFQIWIMYDSGGGSGPVFGGQTHPLDQLKSRLHA